MPNLEFIFVEADSVTTERVFVEKLIIAGWTGRNKDAVEKHIAELEEIGVPRPKSTPIFYHLSSDQLTQNDSISVVGENSSGEVEFFILSHKEALWIGVGSDHTDRKLETYNVTLSKQVCSKPIAKHLWRYDEILKHWEKIKLRSYLKEGGNKILYQEGSVVSMLPINDLMEGVNSKDKMLSKGSLMFCGTLPVIGDVRSSAKFYIELIDPILGRTIRHNYKVLTLPNEG